MKLSVRPETSEDHEAIRDVNMRAFGRPVEALIVERVRSTSAFLPELSLVAEQDGRIVGHVLFSEAVIEGVAERWTVLALGPVAVIPERQRQGVGSLMIETGLKWSAELGYRAVLLIGHPGYYPRFGFVPAKAHEIEPRFSVPDDVFMVRLLRLDGLEGVQGAFAFPPAFDE